MLLVFGHLHASFCRPDDVGILETVGEVVDEQVLHHAGIAVLLLDVDVVPVDVAIEYAFRDIQFRRGLFHGYQQGPELHLCLRGDNVLEIEGHSAKYQAEQDERTDNPEQRNPGCFHGKKLELFPEVTESHQCGQQDGQGEGNRNQSERRIKEELRQ